jgi:hypothetical protein
LEEKKEKAGVRVSIKDRDARREEDKRQDFFFPSAEDKTKGRMKRREGGTALYPAPPTARLCPLLLPCPVLLGSFTNKPYKVGFF